MLSQCANLLSGAEKRLGDSTVSIIYILMSTSFYFCMLVWSKIHMGDLPLVQGQIYRGVLMCILIYFFAKKNNVSLVVENRKEDKIRIYRNIIAGIYNAFCFVILQKIPISTVLIIQTSTPFMVAFIDHMTHKTTYTKTEIIFSFVSMFGIVLIIKPNLFFDVEIVSQSTYGYAEGFERAVWIGFFVAASALWSVSIVMLKKLRNMHTFPMNFPFGVWIIIGGSIIQISYNDIAVPSVWTVIQVIMVLGVISFANQFCYVKANQLGKPAKIGMLFNLNVVMSFLFERYYLGEHKGWVAFLGAGLILGSSVMLSISRLKTSPK